MMNNRYKINDSHHESLINSSSLWTSFLCVSCTIIVTVLIDDSVDSVDDDKGAHRTYLFI